MFHTHYNRSSQAYDGDLTILAVTDPLVYKTLLSVLEDPTTGTRFRDSGLEHFATSRLVYERWSEFLGYRVFEGRNEYSLPSRCNALKRTLW